VNAQKDRPVQDAPAPPAAYVPDRSCICDGYGSIPDTEEVGDGAYYTHSVPCPRCSPAVAARSVQP
jgi:hypothetical protein